jgi:hypothetical protein
VQDYDENVLVRLQFDCAALGQRVCDGLMSVQPWLLRWLDAGRVRDSQVLSVVDSIDKSNQVHYGVDVDQGGRERGRGR